MRAVFAWVRAGLCAALLWITGASVRAQETPMAVVVRVGGEVDRALAQRVEGQLVDLPVHCQVLETGAAPAHLAAAVRESRELADHHGARVVVWFETDPAVVAYVAEPGARRLLVRELGPLEPAAQRSAQLEAAALVVRTAVRALTSGGEMGTDEQELVPPEPTPAPVPPVPSVPPPPAPARPAPAEHEPRHWRAELAAQAGLDGASLHGAYAARAALSWHRKRLELGLRGTAGIPVGLVQPDANVQLSRSSFEGVLGLVAWSGSAVELVGNFGVGLALYRTTVQSRADDFDASSPQRTPLLLLSAELVLRHFPAALRGFGWGVEVGIDGLPRRPELVVEDGNMQVVREALYRVAPRVGLALVWRR